MTGPFDYIVVGAGTAGCVLAARLSEDAGVRVALIEAGPTDSNPYIHIPAAVAAAMFHPKIGWGYFTEPQPELNGRRIPMPRGRVVGGSGAINGMAYNRGHPRDYDDWAAAGNVGWSYREVLPYFIRSEKNEAWAGSPYHGVGGPMNVIEIDRPNPLNSAFLGALASLQYRKTPDFNGPDPEGYGLRQATIRSGRRESTATAFLRPAMARRNLTVITDALVTGIAIEDGRAVGVDIERGGKPARLSAQREVALCAGAIGTPQILQLSGVGDGAALAAAGVTVRHHLPEVGANLQDHLASSVQMTTENTESYGISWRTLPRGAWILAQYALFRRGPLASNVFESTAFLKSDPARDRPDLQFAFQPARRNPTPFPIPIGHGYALSQVLLYPMSRGTVALEGPDPRAAPLIDPRLLSAPEDLEPLLRGVRMARQMLAAPAFAKYRATETAPGPDVADRDALVDYIRRTASTVHHPAGTCRMGADAASVVDPELKVRGIAGLRIADASVFPRLVGGNTNAPVVMVAEKAADMMRGRLAPPPADVPPLAPSILG
ncbi:MAG: GMC family oxidoreductase N-terminal domain-containing protein [Caulobacteraceae bacterium]